MWKYIVESIGIKIFFGIVVFIAINIVVLLSKERNIKHSIAKSNTTSLEKRYELITTPRRIWTGALAGFVLSFMLVILYSILRFRYISIFTEMGAVFVGFVGGVIGSLFVLIRLEGKS